jgi:hypothetical protein
MEHRLDNNVSDRYFHSNFVISFRGLYMSD